MYFFNASLFISRTPLDASLGSNAVRILRIIGLLFPTWVNANNMPQMMVSVITGIAILIYLDKNIYRKIAAKKQKIAVRVPDVNMPYVHIKPAMRNKILSFFSFVVIEII